MMSPAELRLATVLMERASDEFGNHGCNDIPREVEALFSQEEKDMLNKAFHEHNRSPEDYLPGQQLLPNDSCWMSYLAKKLKQCSSL